MDFRVITESSAHLIGKLDYLELRHHLLAQNLAHLETPNYLRQDMVFEGFMEREVEDMEVGALPMMRQETDKTRIKTNGNNVKLEEEMARMTSNSVEYMSAVETLKKNLALMKIAVADK